MGNFLSLSGIIGKNQEEVLASLTNYANSVNGGIQPELFNSDNENCCIIESANGNTTIFYPDGYIEWDTSSAYISKELKSPVFSCHIHDGDLWMYILYYDGQIVDQFNPIPDYWTEEISKDEIESWKGNASAVAKYISNLNPKDVENYLVRWDLDEEESSKAYPDDEFSKEEWQLTDFMKKVRLPYPIDDNGNPKGLTYKFWTEKLHLAPENNKVKTKAENKKPPWWKFW